MYEEGQYDPVTGELIFERVELSSRYVKPLEIELITSREEYDRQIKAVLARRQYKLWVSQFLLDIIVDRQVSSPALGLYCFLGQSIGYGTYVYLSTKEMVQGSGYVRQTVYKSLQELEDKYLIRKIPNKLKEREDRFYFVNPLYFYLGYYPNRENALKEWMEMGSG